MGEKKLYAHGYILAGKIKRINSKKINKTLTIFCVILPYDEELTVMTLFYTKYYTQFS